MISDTFYDSLYNNSSKIGREYLNEAGYPKVTDSQGLDKLILKVLKDYRDGKIDDFTLAFIFSQFEADPLHHYSKYKEPFHLGLDLDFFIIEEDEKSLKETKEKILNWIKTNHPNL